MKLLLASIVFCFTLTSSALTIEKILAIVDSDIVTLTDFNSYKKKIKNKRLLEDSILKTKNIKKLLSNKKRLINHLIDEKILDSEIKKQQMNATTEEVEAEIRKISKRSQLSKKDFLKTMRQQGILLKEYQRFIKKSIERHRFLVKEIGSKIQVTDGDIKSYLASKGKRIGFVSIYKISHILFSSNKGGEKAAKKRAEKVLKKINSRNFNQMVKEYTEEESPSKNGLLGTFESDEILPAMKKAISSLNTGGVSRLVKTDSGYHILKLLSKKTKKKKVDTEIRAQVQQFLYQKAFFGEIKAWLQQKRENSFVKIN